MRILVVKQSLAWPRSSGHDVHTFHLMKACAELGHEVALATAHEPRPEAVPVVSLDGLGRPVNREARGDEDRGIDARHEHGELIEDIQTGADSGA